MATKAEKHPLSQVVSGRSRADVEAPRSGSKVVRFLKLLGRDTIADSIANVGAMMAYYAILSLFPMLVFVITIALLVIDRETIQQGVSMLTTAMPEPTVQTISGHIDSLIETAGAGFAIVGLVLALWGASRGAVALSGALNSIFNKRETRSWILRQLIAIAVTAGLAVLVVIALGLLVAGPVVGHWLTDRFGLGGAFDVAWGVARWIGAGLLVMFVWAVVYKFLANTDAPFRVFTPGAVVGVVLWLGISYGFGVYLRHFNSYDATYGTLGGAIIFLTWLWLSNIALLFGAEINDVLADFRRHDSAAAAQLANEHEHDPPATG